LKISIITVTYNSDKFLEECIVSVLNQNYNNIEYIIIDGGSNDNTLSIIEKYIKHIHYFISESDHGIYDAINKGINISTGEIIGVLNSDDKFTHVNVLSNIIENFKKYKSEIIFGNITFINNNNKIIRYYNSKYFIPFLFRFGFQPAHPTFYTYRKNFIKYGSYNSSFKISGDFELMLRFLFIYKLSYVFVDNNFVTMRLGGASNKSFYNKIKLNDEILRSLKSHHIYTNYFFIYSKYLIKWIGYIIK
jgi:glycosyltransferase involved in cell wall biosynthesis